MNKEQLLEALELTEGELRDFLAKIERFIASLDAKERAAYLRSQPTLKEAVASFGGAVTAEELQQLFHLDSPTSVTVAFILSKPLKPR